MIILSFTHGAPSVNTYFVTADEKVCVVIDPGINACEVFTFAEKHALTIGAVLLTHAHFNHAASGADFIKRNIPVYINNEDENMLSSLDNLAAFSGVKFEPFSPTGFALDGETLTLASIDFLVLHTAGHTRGSTCFIAERTMFSGDTLFFESVGRTDLPSGDGKELAHSLEKLLSLIGDYTVLPGHGRATTLAHEREFNPYV